MLVPELDTPEALFDWMVARGVLTEAQAAEAVAAVRADLATGGSDPLAHLEGLAQLTDAEAMALALSDLARLDARRGRR